MDEKQADSLRIHLRNLRLIIENDLEPFCSHPNLKKTKDRLAEINRTLHKNEMAMLTNVRDQEPMSIKELHSYLKGEIQEFLTPFYFSKGKPFSDNI